jgi:hypothetical protein
VSDAPDEVEYERVLRAELERRIAALAAEGEQAFGHMGTVDVLLIAVGCLLLPGLLVWWFR